MSLLNRRKERTKKGGDAWDRRGGERISCTTTVTDGRIASIIYFFLIFILYSNVVCFIIKHYYLVFPFCYCSCCSLWSRKISIACVSVMTDKFVSCFPFSFFLLHKVYVLVFRAPALDEWNGTRRDETERDEAEAEYHFSFCFLLW